MGIATNWIVACAKCGLRWNRGGQQSPMAVYERQEVESRPCPGCGAYTLTCRELKHNGPRPSIRRAA